MPRFQNELLTFALFVALAGCASTTSTSGTSRTVAMRPGSADIRMMAELLRMEDRRVLDTAVVALGVSSPNADVRARAVLAGGRVGDRSIAPLLRPALSDADERVAAAAAFALGELGDTALANVTALRDVMMLPQAGDRAEEAAHALGKLISQPAYDALAGLLRTTGTPAARATVANAVTAEALLAIWHHPRQPATTALVIPHATSPDRGVRFAATYALVRGAPRAASVPTLMRAITDRDPLVRETAARGLRFVIVDSAGALPAARLALTRALQDSSSRVRINAVRTLGLYRDASLADPIASLLQDDDGNVRISAVSALADLGGADAIAHLTRVASDVTAGIAARGVALAAAVRLAPGVGLPIARAWVNDTSWLQRLYGVRALSSAPYADVAADLRRHTRDRDPRVEAEALGAIVAADTADTTHALDALYLETLASADPLVRAAAISALGRHRDAVYVSALMDAYDRAQNDRENDAALAAVDALGRLARADSAVARSFFFRFPRSRDPVVRSAVHRSLGVGSWGITLPAADRPLAYYEEIVGRLVAPVLAGGPRPRAAILSASGEVVLELASEDAPLTVDNFVTLARAGYFDGPQKRWHRVVPNFVLQDGDPRGDGSGGPGYAIRDEINRLRYTRGALGMALSGPDTGGSQFFITHSPQPHLDGGYTVFGYVVAGITTADRIVQDEPILRIEIR